MTGLNRCGSTHFIVLIECTDTCLAMFMGRSDSIFGLSPLRDVFLVLFKPVTNLDSLRCRFYYKKRINLLVKYTYSIKYNI